MNSGWCYRSEHGQICRVKGTQTLWGETICRLWIVDRIIERIRAQARNSRESTSLLGTTEGLSSDEAQRLMAHPFPYWVERVTVSYLRSNGGQAVKNGRTWELTWPDGKEVTSAVFSTRDEVSVPGAHPLTLENARIRELATRLPRFAPGQPIPCLAVAGLSTEISGYWSLLKISIHTDEWNRRRIMPIFLHDDGRSLLPTARHIREQLLTHSPEVISHVSGDEARIAYEQILQAAESQEKTVYSELMQTRKHRVNREREKGEFAFEARRRVVERVGLPAVRMHRLAQLEEEEKTWREQLSRKNQVIPEMVVLVLVRLDGSATHD